ncbi:MAG: hypothetical protein Q4A75_06700 [Peptostreptococcaceae bacterium]|nr:hypothetical protein [Peptostreptococcaceae bacterium]
MILLDNSMKGRSEIMVYFRGTTHIFGKSIDRDPVVWFGSKNDIKADALM